ncbi:MAG: DUF839 domain-containing protein [Bauldia sp.]|nr:DUF839 domain-containing protein [Bauldia sp.]
MGKANFSNSAWAVNVNLAAGIATTFTGSVGVLSTAAPMLLPENGYSVVSLFTVGEALAATTGALNPFTAGTYVPAGTPDGIGAFRLDADTVRVLVNHELTSAAPFQISNGAGAAVTLDGARISYFDLDRATMAVVDAGLAIRTIHDRDGALVTSPAQLDTASGLTRLCSATLVEAASFGPGRGLADRVFLTGEETNDSGHPHGGSVWALDADTGDLWAVPEMGRGKWENVAAIDTGDTSRVAFLLTDDSSGSALYLYVGAKQAGDFLDRNGLRDGALYVWTSDTGDLSPSDFPSGTREGTFVAVAVRDVGHAGDPGYDGNGYLNASTLAAAADAAGAFSFRRPEDIDSNPLEGNEAVFATTGIASSSDHAGTIYKIAVDFGGTEPAGEISIVYNANADPAQRIRNPDNVDWSADGYVYIQEGPALAGLFGTGAVNPHEASILRLDPDTAAVLRVAAIDRNAAGPFGASDGSPGAVGAWESSGIVDVSTLFGRPAGSLFLADIQAHTVGDGPIAAGDLGRGGQLVLIAAPGVTPPTQVVQRDVAGFDKAVGSRFADTLIGNAAANKLVGGKGGDSIDGGAGDDLLRGGKGSDVILGRDGRDRIVGEAGADALTGGADKDTFVFARMSDLARKVARTDLVTDFEAGLDKIHLGKLDARTGDGNQAFRWIGDKPFHDRPGELRYKTRDKPGTDDDLRVVEGDRNGDGRADFRIKLAGLGDLHAADFVL